MQEQRAVEAILRRRNEAPLSVDPARSALLIVDVQGIFVNPDYPLGRLYEELFPGVTEGYVRRVRETVLPNIRRLQEAFRGRGMSVLYTAIGTRTGDGRDLPGWLREFDELGLSLLDERVWPPVGDPSWEVDETVAPVRGEPVFTKTSSGPVASTRLDQALRHMGKETLFVTGLTTDVCVAQSARELADRGFAVVVVEDACTALSEEMHRAALQGFNIVFGRVKGAAEVVELLAAAGQPTSGGTSTAPRAPAAE